MTFLSQESFKTDEVGYPTKALVESKIIKAVADVILKLRSISLICVSLFLMYLFTDSSQAIKNEAENLRNKLWECSWINKPIWFQKTMLIMMTCATRPLAIKPFGLYELNLQNYSKVVNAAYSFYNIVKSFKNEL